MAPTTIAANGVFGLPGPGRFEVGGFTLDNGSGTTCPTQFRFVPTSSGPVFDRGWSGFGFNQTIMQQGTMTVDAACTGTYGAPGGCSCTFPSPHKNVFVTSTQQNGNLGDLAGADSLCQTRAAAASLTGYYKAWLSSASVTSRLTHATVRYLLPGGIKVADDWTDLTDGSLDAPIDRDEFGAPVPGTNHVWTGSTDAGDILGNTCGSWTLDAAAYGHKGHSDATNSQWSDDPTLDVCNVTNRLYCLEQ